MLSASTHCMRHKCFLYILFDNRISRHPIMTILEFRRLRELNQLKIAKRRAVFLAERTDKENRYKLYQLDAFYIEFIYALHDPVLKEIDIFGGTALLDPYLDNIRI